MKRMKLTALSIALLLLAACGGGGGGSSSTSSASSSSSSGTAYTLSGEFESHRYSVYRPTKLGAEKSLLILLHGAYQQRDSTEAMWSGKAFADANAYVLAIPQGDNDVWNYTSDVDWILNFVAKLQADEGPFKAVYLAGWSNGSCLSQQVACQQQGQITGVISYAGERVSYAACEPTHPIAVSLIHGTADTVVPISGGAFGTMSAQAAFDFWRSRNACSANTQTGSPFSLNPNSTTSTQEALACQAPVSLTTWASGHQPNWTPTGLHALMLDFFNRAAQSSPSL